MLSHVWLFATPWTAVRQASLCFTITLSLLKLRSIKSVIPSNSLNLCHPLLLPSIFPSIWVFSNELALHIGAQNIGASASASASVLPMNIQGWFPLGLTGLISLLSKGPSRVFSRPQFKSISSSGIRFLYGPVFTSVQDCWENHSFDYMNFCWQSDVCAF